MKIKTQFVITTVFFCLILSVIGIWAFITNQRLQAAGQLALSAVNIIQEANDLDNLSRDYMVFRKSRNLEIWRTRFLSQSANLKNMLPDKPEYNALVQNLHLNQKKSNEILDRIAELNGTIDNATLHNSLDKMTAHTRALVLDSIRLSQLLRIKSDNLAKIRSAIMYIIIVVFGLFLLSVYMFTHRRILNSINAVRNSTAGAGTGKLSNTFKKKMNDEISDLSHTFNQMTEDLKTVTASKVLLEKEISERKLAEESQRISKERLALLASVAERLLKSEDPQYIVKDLCSLVMEKIDCQFFFNYLSDAQGKVLNLNAFAGIPPEAASRMQQLSFGSSVCGCAAQVREPIIMEDIQNSSDPKIEIIKPLGIVAYCCHPLLVQDKLIGTLSFGTATRTAFSFDEIALIKSVSDQVAVAMQRLISQKELLTLNETLERQVAERTGQAEARSRQLQALAVELIEAEERERQRVAQLLHDDLQQILAAARMQLEAACRNLPDIPVLSNIDHLLSESIKKSRRLSHELSPPVLYHGSLIESIQWLAKQMEEQFGLKVEIVKSPESVFENELLKVFIFRAVHELLFNIVKHAGIKTARVIFTAINNTGINITVSDNGHGFNPDILDSSSGSIGSDGSIRSDGYASTGFGLLSLRERASYIGGSLTIESAPGTGSKFILSLPLRLTKPKLKRPIAKHNRLVPAISQSAGNGSIRILLVDDHKVLRQGLYRLMSGQPDIQIVGEAGNGLEAIEQVRQLQPNVVIMDISMPEMDGVEATRRIKNEWPDVCVIGLSMFEDEQINERMRTAGAEAFVSKTASTSVLLRTIYTCMNLIKNPASLS